LQLLLHKVKKRISRPTRQKNEAIFFFYPLKEEENYQTLKREPIEQNSDDLDESSAEGGNKPATKEHPEALKSA